MMKRILGIIVLSGMGMSCASITPSTGVVVGTRPQPHWFKRTFLATEKEKAAIPTDSGLSLHYDRTDVVFYENTMPDGSVWLHYAAVLKNSSGGSVGIRGEQIELIADNVPTEVPVNQIPKDATDLEGKPIEEQSVGSKQSDQIILSQSADEEAPKTEETKADAPPPAPIVKTRKVLTRHAAKAEFKKGERLSSVASKSYSRTQLMFRIKKEVVEHFAGNPLPLHLQVPMTNGRSLRLPVWLWRVE